MAAAWAACWRVWRGGWLYVQQSVAGTGAGVLLLLLAGWLLAAAYCTVELGCSQGGARDYAGVELVEPRCGHPTDHGVPTTLQTPSNSAQRRLSWTLQTDLPALLFDPTYNTQDAPPRRRVCFRSARLRHAEHPCPPPHPSPNPRSRGLSADYHGDALLKAPAPNASRFLVRPYTTIRLRSQHAFAPQVAAIERDQACGAQPWWSSRRALASP